MNVNLMHEQQKYIFPILIALIVAIFPHISRLPIWIILWCAGMWGYLVLSVRFRWPPPGNLVRRVLTVIGIAGLLFTFSRRLDQNAYLGLLAVMAALKPFEMKTHRDRMVTVFLAYFIVITSLFLSETLAITLYMLLSVCISTAVLIRVNDPSGRFRDNLRLATLILAQAIPLMILLFFLFPRIEGSLFGFSMGNSGKSGFSDNLAPGSVASLVEDDTVAFRAEFKKKIPPSSMLYWRGIVFQDFDGRRWHAQKQPQESFTLPEGQDPVEYTVTLEPHNNRWMFALEMPAIIPPTARFYADYTLRARRTVSRKIRYSIASNVRYHSAAERQWKLHRLTKLPDSGNAQVRALAAKLTETARNDDEKAARILDFFRTGGFIYTLQPPRLGVDPVDDFIFKSKKGYCEHYASAFAVMMRSVNVPARIVGGYQGGEVNPFGDYLVVRQSDAHVWVEIWHPERGWTRVDPTAVVAPIRISQGMPGVRLQGERVESLTRQYLGSLSGFMKQVRFGWDALSTQWSAFFEGYSYYEQKALLEKIGITSGLLAASLKAMLLLLAVVGIIVGAYAWFALKPPGQKPDAVKKYYSRFCEKLSRAGFERQANQGPVDYAAYVVKNRPDLKNRITDISDLYVQLRYRNETSKALLAEFIQKVKAFDPVLK